MRDSLQQDLLRLLTLWFRFGGQSHVETTLREGFDLVDINMWLLVIPQIIARISSPNIRVRKSVHTLLLRVGKKHPQVLQTKICCHASVTHLPARSRRRRSSTLLLSRRTRREIMKGRHPRGAGGLSAS